MPFLRRVLLVSASALILATTTFAAPPSKSGGSLASGQVGSTNNPQVAQYTLSLPQPGSWFVSFGTTTAYGRTTSVQTVAAAGKRTSMYVAGMLPSTTYHMQATVTLADGTTTTDQDHVFTAGPLPAGFPAVIPVTIGTTGTPQEGIELIDNLIGGMPSSLVATDLQGNVIWTYGLDHVVQEPYLYPGKLLPNGDFLAFICSSSYPVDTTNGNILREFDLAGNTVRQLSLQQLNAGLSKLGFKDKLETFSHDFVLLPNGHLLVIANMGRNFTNLTGIPGTSYVIGDVVVDLDPDWNPVWLWNEFDYFDVNRHPMGFPDWTHSNSLAYSPDDGNFLVSIRHQNWVVKVDYSNGAGNGNVLWKLGEGSDFKLQGGIDPTDWFYAQHDAEFVGPRSAGLFSLSVMDNGNDRIYANGCGTGSEPPCSYTSIQILQIDETAKTATFQFHQILPPYLFSFWGGNVEVLANGDIEYDLSGTAGGSQIFEVTNQGTPQMVWNQTVLNTGAYRAFRLPSLYPGVQW